MTATAVRAEVPPPEPRSSGRSLGWWGTVALIATESMIFALLLFGNFYLRAQADEWPLGGIADPELLKSGIRTAILLGTTIPVVIAERGIRRGRRGHMMWGIGVAWLMAAVFMAGHVEEYVHLFEEGVRPGTNAYTSAFYTITALHALHLTAGMGALAYVWLRGLAGHYDAHDHDAVENTALYWHFVDVVWVFVYSSLYLSVTWL